MLWVLLNPEQLACTIIHGVWFVEVTVRLWQVHLHWHSLSIPKFCSRAYVTLNSSTARITGLWTIITMGILYSRTVLKVQFYSKTYTTTCPTAVVLNIALRKRWHDCIWQPSLLHLLIIYSSSFFYMEFFFFCYRIYMLSTFVHLVSLTSHGKKKTCYRFHVAIHVKC